MIDELNSMKVHSLIIPDTRQWDIPLIQALFQPCDMKEITSIPSQNSAPNDLQIWYFSRNGSYTVKSSYRLFMDNIIDHSQ